jgi:hypothetical protein
MSTINNDEITKIWNERNFKHQDTETLEPCDEDDEDDDDEFTDIIVMTIDNRENDVAPQIKRNNPYDLLLGYANEATVHSTAHDLTAHFYLDVAKLLNYPLIVLSAGSSIMAGLALHRYWVIGVNLSMLTLTAFDHVVNPRDKAQTHMLSKIEFEEVASNIKQYVGSNSRSKEEIKDFSEEIYNYLTKWKSIAPNIPRRYMSQAQRACSHITRPTTERTPQRRTLLEII